MRFDIKSDERTELNRSAIETGWLKLPAACGKNRGGAKFGSPIDETGKRDLPGDGDKNLDLDRPGRRGGRGAGGRWRLWGSLEGIGLGRLNWWEDWQRTPKRPSPFDQPEDRIIEDLILLRLARQLGHPNRRLTKIGDFGLLSGDRRLLGQLDGTSKCLDRTSAVLLNLLRIGIDQCGLRQEQIPDIPRFSIIGDDASCQLGTAQPIGDPQLNRRQFSRRHIRHHPTILKATVPGDEIMNLTPVRQGNTVMAEGANRIPLPRQTSALLKIVAGQGLIVEPKGGDGRQTKSLITDKRSGGIIGLKFQGGLKLLEGLLQSDRPIESFSLLNKLRSSQLNGRGG